MTMTNDIKQISAKQRSLNIIRDAYQVLGQFDEIIEREVKATEPNLETYNENNHLQEVLKDVITCMEYTANRLKLLLRE